MLTRRGGEVYAPPRNDAYVVLLIISLVAMILGCALLWMDYSSYPSDKAPDKVSVRQPAPPQAGQVQTPPNQQVVPPDGKKQ
jgi:hypothetical protein